MDTILNNFKKKKKKKIKIKTVSVRLLPHVQLAALNLPCLSTLNLHNKQVIHKCILP